MTDEIEFVRDGDSLLIAGDRNAIQRFLNHYGMLEHAEDVGWKRLATVLDTSADIAQTASNIAEQSIYYLKLTPESAKRLRDAGGLMKTGTKGISHAMLGETGKKSMKWLQVQDGPTSLFSNPAVLSGVGGLMSQFARQAEAKELRSLLIRIDSKLDDVRRTQRDAVVAKLNRAAAAIEEAMTIYEHGGDPRTLWDKVNGESATILEVQSTALAALGALADKVEGKTKLGELRKATREVEFEAAVQLAILARCFELVDKFKVVELDHVFATAPETLDGHRRGVEAFLDERRTHVVHQTRKVMIRMEEAAGIANANILLHARAAQSIVNALNATSALVDDFYAPLGIEATRGAISVTRWGDALRDPQQLKRAGAEAGQKSLIAGGTAAAIVLGLEGTKRASGRTE